MRGRVMRANTWHSQGTMAGFNAINGLLMDMPWMTAPLLLGGPGIFFAVIMLGSVLLMHLRALYPWHDCGDTGAIGRCPAIPPPVLCDPALQVRL